VDDLVAAARGAQLLDHRSHSERMHALNLSFPGSKKGRRVGPSAVDAPELRKARICRRRLRTGQGEGAGRHRATILVAATASTIRGLPQLPGLGAVLPRLPPDADARVDGDAAVGEREHGVQVELGDLGNVLCKAG